MLSNLKKFVGVVILNDVFLKSQTAISNVFPRSIDPSKLSLNFDFNSRYEKYENENLFISYQSLQVKTVNAKDSKDKMIEIDIFVEFALVYNYQNFTGDLTDEIMLEFCRTSALFNAYPYLRESIHSLSCKMGVPPIVAPLLKIESPKAPVKEDVVKKVQKKIVRKKVKA